MAKEFFIQLFFFLALCGCGNGNNADRKATIKGSGSASITEYPDTTVNYYNWLTNKYEGPQADFLNSDSAKVGYAIDQDNSKVNCYDSVTGKWTGPDAEILNKKYMRYGYAYYDEADNKWKWYVPDSIKKQMTKKDWSDLYEFINKH